MIKHIILNISIFFSIAIYGQNTSDFLLLDYQKSILCYSERDNGVPLKNTTASFKNKSTCDGECLYIWKSGEPDSEQFITDNTDNFEYTYTIDGKHPVSLQLINKTSIDDSILNKTITHVEAYQEIDDSIDIQITYRGGDNVEKIAQLRIPAEQYDMSDKSQYITVYSPLASGNNFTYEIDDPSTQEQPAPLQSYSYVLQVNQENFTPHKPDYWTYYWEIYNANSFNEPDKKIDEFKTDSLSYVYTFPLENYDPGYFVKLKIGLDTSKFENEIILDDHDLWGCVASQSSIVDVSDHFFTEETRTEDNVDNREPKVPNIFTPGGNDENEVFYFNTNGIDIFTVAIYNSWGDLVYSKEAHTITWTGKDNAGKKCPSGTYYYVIYSNKSDERHKTGGYIHLFRQN
ncbi:MAG: gliding motility-associated C-terminal domain-containing protein [Bacteroidales bacterium]